MSLIASHVLIGLPDHQQGGVAPSHAASLSMSADGWSSWTLESREGRSKVFWVVDAEGQEFDELILMTSIYVLEDQAVRDLTADLAPELLELAEFHMAQFPREAIHRLLTECREPTWEDLKLVVTMMSGFSTAGLVSLTNYPVQCEICTPTFTRLKALGQIDDDALRDEGEIAITGLGVAAGELVRWRDERGPASLGIVLYPTTDELAFVLVVDNSGNSDVEAFSARPHDTGVTAPAMVLEMMEVVLNPDPQLVRPLLEQLPEIQAELSSPG